MPPFGLLALHMAFIGGLIISQGRGSIVRCFPDGVLKERLLFLFYFFFFLHTPITFV